MSFETMQQKVWVAQQAVARHTQLIARETAAGRDSWNAKIHLHALKAEQARQSYYRDLARWDIHHAPGSSRLDIHRFRKASAANRLQVVR